MPRDFIAGQAESAIVVLTNRGWSYDEKKGTWRKDIADMMSSKICTTVEAMNFEIEADVKRSFREKREREEHERRVKSDVPIGRALKVGDGGF